MMSRAVILLLVAMVAACRGNDAEVDRLPGCEDARPISELAPPLDRLISEYVWAPNGLGPTGVRASLYTGPYNPAEVDPETHQVVHLFAGCAEMKPTDVWLGRAVVVAVDRRDGSIQTLGLGP